MKRILIILFSLYIIFSATACGGGSAQYDDPTTPNIALAGSDEFNIRVVIEADSFYTAFPSGQQKIVDVKKYGVDQYTQYRNWISFENLEDMETVFKSTDFRKDFNDIFGIIFDIDDYYLPQKIENDVYGISLYVINQNYYLSIGSGEFNEDLSMKYFWNVFDTSQDVDAQETAQFYANEDGLELKSAKLPDGNDVNYFTAEKGCSLFTGMNWVADQPATAYLWEQDGVLGVIICMGEHKDENFDLCVLERHAL